MSQPSEDIVTQREVAEWMRGKLIERLRREGAEDVAGPLARCGEVIRMTCTCCFATKECHTQCRRRWCPVCQRAISAARLHRFASAASRMQRPLSIMLSHTNEADPANAFRTLMPAFKRFRRTKLWKNNVKGGVISYEVTNRFGTWHDHLHALVDCRWLAISTPEPRKSDTRSVWRKKLKAAKHELSEAWAQCVGQDEAVTWVDRADQGRLMEHIKYCVKGSDLLKCESRIAPLLRALKGRRLVQPFGNLYGLAKQWKLEDDQHTAPLPCERCAAVGSMLPDFLVGQEIDKMRAGRRHRIKAKRF